MTSTAFLDTNVLIRHLTGDPPAQARRATAFLAAAEGPLLLADLIVAEIVDVLESVYDVDRSMVADLVRAIIAFPSIAVVQGPLLLRALEAYEHDRLDFADAYLVACAEATGVGRVVSFDRGLDRAGTVERVEP